MATTKPKSGLSEPANHKNATTPSTPRVSKLGRPGSSKSDLGSPAPRQNPPRLSADRSPDSTVSKPAVSRRSPGGGGVVATPSTPDKQARALKGPELQAQLTAIQDDLKKAKERLASVEDEKEKALEELKDAKKVADEANGKLAEALLAQRKAEESSEIEKFRADELEQAGIDASQRREEEWRSELESVRSAHAVDVAALLSTGQELQRATQELAMATDAKNAALSHADDAMRIAEINAEKVEVLSGEVSRLKSLLDSQLESKSNEAQELVRKLDSEIAALKQELEKAKAAEEKLVEMEALAEELRAKVSDTERAEKNASGLADEFRKEVESLESRLEENSLSEKLVQESLASARRELEQSSSLLSDAESEITSLRRMVEGLELAVARHKEELEISSRGLGTAQQVALEMGRTIEALKSELEQVEEGKRRALGNEEALASDLEGLSEEKNKLVAELGIAREEGEKVKEAMDRLSSALHEVSAEARETKEKLLAKEAEADSASARIEELESSLRAAKESYEVRLVEAGRVIDCLKEACKISETEAENSRAERNAKEVGLLSSIENLEGEICAMKARMDELAEEVQGAEKEVQAAREAQVQLQDKLIQAQTEASLAVQSMEEVETECAQLKQSLADKESEVQSISRAAKENEARLLSRLSKSEQEAAVASRAAEEVKTDSFLLKDRLLDKEKELQSITQENEDLRTREAAAREKIRELSALLAEAATEKDGERVELSNGGKDHGLPVPEPTDAEEETEPEVPFSDLEASNGNWNAQESNAVEVVNKGFSPEREHEAESVDDDADSKVDCASLDRTNGLSSKNLDGNGAVSPTKPRQPKKKKPLLQKFGSLLKKKSSPK